MTGYLLLLPFFFQMLIISIDEFGFHIQRGLPKWERIGHPLDTLTVLACFGFILFAPYSTTSLWIYIAMALFSCVFVTKDEFVHKECCPASEQWLHALLFLNHPVVLTAAGLLWPLLSGGPTLSWVATLDQPFIHTFFALQVAFTALFLLYQIIYWNFVWKTAK